MSFNQLRSVLSQGTQFLGDLVWWALTDARIDRNTLENIWQDAGLAPELLPEIPTVEKALKTAVRECQVGQRERLVRLGKEDEGELVFAIVHETKHPDGSVSFTQEARLVLDRKAESLSADVPQHDLVASIRAAYQRLRHEHTPDDVRRAMLRTLDACAAVTLREHGGIYWVPSPHADQVHRLQQAVERIGASKVYLLPVHRSNESERTLGTVARGAMEEELAALKTEMAEFIAFPPNRVSTLVRRLDAFEQLKTKAALYHDLLSVEVADLDQQLSKLTATAEALLNQRTAA